MRSRHLAASANPREGLRAVSEPARHDDRADSLFWLEGPGPARLAPSTHMLRFCLAFSMSLLISGVMLNRSFLGMGRGTMGDRTSSGFFLHRTWGSQAPAGSLGSLGPSPGLGWGGWVPKAGGDQPRDTLGFFLLKTAFISAFKW